MYLSTPPVLTVFGAEGGDWENRGLIPRSIEYILERADQLMRGQHKTFHFYVSFLEIYLDKIRDLGRAAAGALNFSPMSDDHLTMPMPGSIQPHGGNRGGGLDRTRSGGASLGGLSRAKSMRTSGDGTTAGSAPPGAQTATLAEVVAEGGASDYDSQNLEIWETREGQTYVKDLYQLEVTSVHDVMAVLNAGYGLRRTNATNMNEVSSRSHTVFTISVVSTQSDGSHPLVGRLNLVDLAGSERVKKSGSEGQRFKEAVHINQSLSALAKVVLSLASGDSSAHVPYRDSKLTRILKDSLAGNSYTTVLANVNPTANNVDESLLTLNFAQRCSSIIMKPRVNNAGEEENQVRGQGKDKKNSEPLQLPAHSTVSSRPRVRLFLIACTCDGC
jgi:hypothetical protein